MATGSAQNLDEVIFVPAKREAPAYLSLANSLNKYFERRPNNISDYRGVAHGLYTSLCAVSAMKVANGEKALDLSRYDSQLSLQPPIDGPEIRLLAFELSDTGYEALSDFVKRLKNELSYSHYNAMEQVIKAHPDNFKDLSCKLKAHPNDIAEIINSAGALDTMLLISSLIEKKEFSFI